jgi:hypothetical protein
MAFLACACGAHIGNPPDLIDDNNDDAGIDAGVDGDDAGPMDDAGPPPAPCTKGQGNVVGGGRCYEAYKQGTVITWSDARAHCQANGGDLAKIVSVAENDLVAQTAALAGASVQSWIGLNDLRTQFRWVWNDEDVPASFFRWDTREPDNGSGQISGGEKCVTIKSDKFWNDAKCEGSVNDEVNSYVCERQAP